MDSNEGLAALFHYANEGILVADSTGSIIRINPAAERMLGFTTGELVGKKVEAIVPDRVAKRHIGHRENFTAHPHARSMGANIDLHAKRKDGTEFPVEISLSPFKTKGETYVIAFMVDITNRKKAEADIVRQKLELERLNSQLENRVKERTMILQEAVEALNHTKEELNEALQKERELNDLKTRFVAMASHEFRTPLATILSSLSLVDRYGEAGEKEKQARHIARIKSSVGTLTDILDDVLSISKLDEGGVSPVPQSFSIRDLAEGLVKEMQAIARSTQKLEYRHEGSEEVYLDKKFLKHILLNLCSNAIKFSPDDGVISIQTSIKGKALHMSVADRGIGIDPEDQKHLFERFFRGKNATNIQGTGLGLNIVARYVELLNGNVSVESKLGEGAKIVMTIPTRYIA